MRVLRLLSFAKVGTERLPRVNSKIVGDPTPDLVTDTISTAAKRNLSVHWTVSVHVPKPLAVVADLEGVLVDSILNHQHLSLFKLR